MWKQEFVLYQFCFGEMKITHTCHVTSLSCVALYVMLYTKSSTLECAILSAPGVIVMILKIRLHLTKTWDMKQYTLSICESRHYMNPGRLFFYNLFSSHVSSQIHLISPGCPRPNSALTVHKSGLKHRPSIHPFPHKHLPVFLCVCVFLWFFFPFLHTALNLNQADNTESESLFAALIQ